MTSIEDALVNYFLTRTPSRERLCNSCAWLPMWLGISLAEIWKAHRAETQAHERLVGTVGSPWLWAIQGKDVVMKAGGVGFVLFRGAPYTGQTPVTCVLLRVFRAGRLQAAFAGCISCRGRGKVDVARRVGDKEQAMAGRLAETFHRVVDTSPGEKDPKTQLPKYLADAQCNRGSGDPAARAGGRKSPAILSWREETQNQQLVIRDRIESTTAPLALKDAVTRLGARNWGMSFQAAGRSRQARSLRLCVRHLEIASTNSSSGSPNESAITKPFVPRRPSTAPRRLRCKPEGSHVEGVFVLRTSVVLRPRLVIPRQT